MKILVGGVFDLFHYGHARFLERAKNLGDHLTVAVNRDEFVMRYKRKNPIMNTTERVELLRNIKWVDEVIVNEKDENWLPVVELIKPQIIVASHEWYAKDYYKQMGISREKLQELEVQLLFIQPTKEISTTKILERIYG